MTFPDIRATIASDYQTFSDYRATIAKNHQRLSRIRKIKNPVFETRRKVFKNRAEIFRKSAGNWAGFERHPGGRQPLSRRQDVPDGGAAARISRWRDCVGRSRARTDGAGRAEIGGAVYLPYRGIKHAHGACRRSHRYAASRACGSAADRAGHAGGCAPSRGGDGGHRAVRLCEALRGAFTLRAI